jgi:2-dehydropantoate 2-reductase
MTRALIFGSGGVGCIYGYILDAAGAEVTAVCRTNYDVVRTRGVIVRSKLFGNVHYNPIAVCSVSEAKGPFDFILVCSKAFPGTSKLIEAAVTDNTAIVLAQNGIGIEDEYTELYPKNTIISGVVWLPATQIEPGKCCICFSSAESRDGS